jgi:D-amino-acid dehydrogenase
LTELNRDAAKCWRSVAADAEANEFVQSLGYLHVYSDRNNFIKGQWERDQMSARGIAFDVLDRDGLLKLEPELGAQFCCGVFQKESLAVLDPGEVCVRLAEFLRRQGVVFEVATVSAIHRVDAGYDVVTDHGTFCSEQVVVAAGAWSTRLLAPFNVTLPIIAARGYHVMFEKATAVVRRPTLWAERYMVLTPMQKGVRMTSIKELTTLDSAPRFQFIRRLLPEAKKLFPALRDQVASEWMGNRPCTPDSLPIIDRVTNENIFVVSGHGHMGLTHGPVSGKLVAQWIAGEKTDINLNPFSYRRFES